MRWLWILTLLVPLACPADAPDFTLLVRQQAGAVVSISSAYATPAVLPDVPYDEALTDLLHSVARGLLPDFNPTPLGSGFLVSSDGYVVTAQHIVEDAANAEVVVRLADGREYPGRVVGMDRTTDIGLVKIEASGLPSVRIGEPRQLQPGEWVATIGTPFGLESTVAAGIVSTTSRTIPSESHVRFIQTDVATNPGHSGGPLFNLAGEVVGVNSMIFSASGGSIGLSFAVPIDVAMEAVQQLRRHGRVTRGRIGVLVQEVTPELAQAFRLPRAAGALLTAVEGQAPADRAGLRAGDVVLRFAGKPVVMHVDLLALVSATPPDTAAQVHFMRNGTPMQVNVRVASADDEAPRRTDAGGTDRLGFRLAPLTDAQRRRLGLEGVLVERAEGTARRAGLIAGDIILSVNAQPTPTPQALRAALARAKAGESAALLVERAGNRAFVPLRVP
jgi:serine protease Do